MVEKNEVTLKQKPTKRNGTITGKVSNFDPNMMWWPKVLDGWSTRSRFMYFLSLQN